VGYVGDGDAEITVTLEVGQLADEVTVRAPSGVATHIAGATRTDTPLIETPQSISVITHEQISSRPTRGATRR
jgi:iron complex outermembrane recepter protein